MNFLVFDGRLVERWHSNRPEQEEARLQRQAYKEFLDSQQNQLFYAVKWGGQRRCPVLIEKSFAGDSRSKHLKSITSDASKVSIRKISNNFKKPDELDFSSEDEKNLQTLLKRSRLSCAEAKKLISQCQVENIAINGGKLRDMYIAKRESLPSWFLECFDNIYSKNDGIMMMGLAPTFDCNAREALPEFYELAKAEFRLKIKLERKDLENGQPSLPCETSLEITELLQVPEKFQREDSGPNGQLWRTGYSGNLNVIASCNERRIEITGRHIDDVSLATKRFVLVLIYETDGISGSYRRQMTTSHKYLTWKFSLKS